MSNTGRAQLRYSITGVATNPDTKGLASQLTVTIRELGTSCAAFDGTVLYSGVVGYAPPTNLVGNPAQGYEATPGTRRPDAQLRRQRDALLPRYPAARDG